MAKREPFWKKPLSSMTRVEWESLCDGCGRCCLIKLEDEESGKFYYTDIACRLFDCVACRCTDYANRMKRVRDCLRLTPKRAAEFGWLPRSCAYRRLAEGRSLAWWHPLRSGTPETVIAAGVSVKGRIHAYERDLPISEYPAHIVEWPAQEPIRVANTTKTTRQRSRRVLAPKSTNLGQAKGTNPNLAPIKKKARSITGP